MKKRLVITLVLVGLLAFGAGMGTFAYFSSTFTSNNNEIKAAVWDVTGEGVVGNKTFKIDKFAPGSEGVFEFKIRENDTEVPIKIDVTLEGSGKLLDGSIDETSPIKFKINGKKYNLGDTITFNGNGSTNFFTVEYKWPWNGDTDDNKFQGKTGKVNINVVARQVKEPNVKYAAAWFDLKSTGERYQTTLRVVMDENNKIKSMEGYNKDLGNISYNSTDDKVTFSEREDLNNKNIKFNTVSDNGKYQFLGGREYIEITLP